MHDDTAVDQNTTLLSASASCNLGRIGTADGEPLHRTVLLGGS